MSSSSRGVAIVGCGLIGHKRANALGRANLVVCADLNSERAEALAQKHSGAAAVADWRDAVTKPEVSIVIVATTKV